MANNLLNLSECIQVFESVHENSFKSGNASRSSVLLNSVDRAKLSAAVQKLTDLNSLQILKTWLTTLEKPVNIEILWSLNKNYLIQISSYLYLFEKFHDYFVGDLVKLATVTENEKYARRILSDILFQLLCVNDSLPSLYKMYQLILDNFVKKVMKIVYLETSQKMFNYMEDLTSDSNFLKSEKEQFCALHLTELLISDPQDILLFDVISEQTQHFESHTLPVTLKQFVSNIFKIFTNEEVFDKIFSVVSGTSFNLWKILSIVSLACKYYGEKSCLEILENRFTESVIDHNKHMVYVTLIFIRQVFLDDSTLFQKYAKWFKNLRLNASQFSFLFQCLDRIVPHEPALYLKIHINEFPNVPCRTTLSDYITLAKTRLLDLGETTEYLGIFHLSDKMGQRADLRKIISHFVETGEVAKLLIEASVFRRQYFNNVFLPYLLGSESEDLEGKTRFIERLNEQGLIPSSRYQLWQRTLRNL